MKLNILLLLTLAGSAQAISFSDYYYGNPLLNIPSHQQEVDKGVASRHLKLADKGLTDLTDFDNGHVPGLQRIQELVLSENQLTTLPATIFRNLRDLEIIDLDNNQLTEIPNDLFRGLSKLQWINLSNNELTELPETVFHGLRKLGDLDLSNNRLTRLGAKTFKGLRRLDRLFLYNNRLTALDENIFQDLRDVENINLSSNQLTSLPENLFQGLHNLIEFLDLSSNRFATLPANVFVDLRGLEDLDLSNNQIVALPENIFNDLADLRELNLAGNNLKTVPANLLTTTQVNGVTPFMLLLFNNPISLTEAQIRKELGSENLLLCFKTRDEEHDEQELFAAIADGNADEMQRALKIILTNKRRCEPAHLHYKVDITKIRNSIGDNLLHAIVLGLNRTLSEISNTRWSRWLSAEEKDDEIKRAEQTYIKMFGSVIQFGGLHALTMLTSRNASGLDVLHDALGSLGPNSALLRMIIKWPTIEELENEQKEKMEKEKEEKEEAFMKWWRDEQTEPNANLLQEPRRSRKRNLELASPLPKKVHIEHVAMEEAPEIIAEQKQREAEQAQRARALAVLGLSLDHDNYQIIAARFKKLSDEYQQILSSPAPAEQKAEAERKIHELNRAWTYLSFGR